MKMKMEMTGIMSMNKNMVGIIRILGLSSTTAKVATFVMLVLIINSHNGYSNHDADFDVGSENNRNRDLYHNNISGDNNNNNNNNNKHEDINININININNNRIKNKNKNKNKNRNKNDNTFSNNKNGGNENIVI